MMGMDGIEHGRREYATPTLVHNKLFFFFFLFLHPVPDQIFHAGNQIHSIRHHGHDGVFDAVPS